MRGGWSQRWAGVEFLGRLEVHRGGSGPAFGGGEPRKAVKLVAVGI